MISSEAQIQITDDAELAVGIKRLRIFSHLAIGSFVLFSAFLFGLTSGLSNKISALPIASESLRMFTDESEFAPPNFDHIELPEGVRFVPVGKDMTVNGKTAEVAMFHTDRSIKALTSEMVSKWQQQGLTASGMSGPSRGVGLGVDKLTGARYMLTVWKTPKQLRGLVGGGALTQGMIAYTNPRLGERAEDNAMRGEVPGVPVMPGGVGGSVLSSMDRGGRTYTGTYTNPGQVRDSIDYYLSFFEAKGWHVIQDDLNGKRGPGFGSLQFEREGEQVVLLFSPIPKTSKSEIRTLVTVISGPKSVITG